MGSNHDVEESYFKVMDETSTQVGFLPFQQSRGHDSPSMSNRGRISDIIDFNNNAKVSLDGQKSDTFTPASWQSGQST